MPPERKLRVAVLMGGPPAEYEISLATGRKILQALDGEKYLIQPVIVTKERKWLIPQLKPLLKDKDRIPGVTYLLKRISDTKGHWSRLETREVVEPAFALMPRTEEKALGELGDGNVDVVFIAMHGEFGKDGTVQGLLESIGVPYTGSGVLASALGMDKPKSLAIFRDAGLRVPDFFVVNRTEWHDSEEAIIKGAIETFGLPFVVKPANRGSSVGVTIAQTVSEVESGIANAFTHSETIILQRFIPGTEVTCGVLETETGTIPLQPTQIIPKESNFFDYHSKYTPGASEEITPPRLPAETIHHIQETALKAHQAIGAAGMSRTDIILADDETLYVLEINTIPGMTETSLLPQAAAAIGIPFPKLLDIIIAAALRRKLTN